MVACSKGIGIPLIVGGGSHRSALLRPGLPLRCVDDAALAFTAVVAGNTGAAWYRLMAPYLRRLAPGAAVTTKRSCITANGRMASRSPGSRIADPGCCDRTDIRFKTDADPVNRRTSSKPTSVVFAAIPGTHRTAATAGTGDHQSTPFDCSLFSDTEIPLVGTYDYCCGGSSTLRLTSG
jgi:hypothetical protein